MMFLSKRHSSHVKARSIVESYRSMAVVFHCRYTLSSEGGNVILDRSMDW